MGIVVAKLQHRPHHDGDEEHRDIRLDVAQANGIAVSRDQVAQLSFVIFGYHRHFGTRHEARQAARLVEMSRFEIGCLFIERLA